MWRPCLNPSVRKEVKRQKGKNKSEQNASHLALKPQALFNDRLMRHHTMGQRSANAAAFMFIRGALIVQDPITA